MSKFITGCFLAVSFFGISLDKPVLDNWPNTIKQPSDYGKNNILLKEKFCFSQQRDYSNTDLNHFCKGVQ